MAELARTEAVGGILLTIMVGVALLWANVPAHSSYDAFWQTPAHWRLLPADQFGTVRDWVDNGLMTVFFLAIGLEVGRERVHGSLRTVRNALLPVAAALGGMAGAAVAYLVTVAATAGGPAASRGWGVPMATDVAFTLGAMALLGRRVPPALRVFVLALAVADDVGSVIVLAVVSASRVHVRPWVLAVAVVWFALVAIASRRVRTSWWPYVVAALVEWALLAWGGVEPTLAGAFVGLVVPCVARPPTARPAPSTERPAPSTERSPSAMLERVLNPVSILLVLPLFALANTGVDLGAPGLTSGAGGSVVVGIVVARLVGKLGGITVATAIVVRCRAVELPDGVRWSQLAGAAAMCGMGFTVPLLFATSAFAGHPPLVAAAQIGLLGGTAVAFVVGAAILFATGRSDGDGAAPTGSIWRVGDRTSRRWAPSERQVGDAARGADRLHGEALVERLEPVPETFPTPEEHRHDDDV
ncbi:MAG TPA: Na+/H+ antiporter NhaA [Acidimicrobiales bacterium]